MRLLLVSFACAAHLVACADLADLGTERVRADGGAGGAGGGDGGGGGGVGGAGAGAPTCSGGRVAWATRFGDAAIQEGTTVATDAEGGVFIAGRFAGTIDFGGGPHESAGALDLFVAHFDRDGHHRWSTTIGDADDQDSVVRLAPTSDGGVVMSGYFTGTVDFGDGQPKTAVDNRGFVARYGPGGELSWVRTFGGDAASFVDGLVIHPDGRLWAGGVFYTGVVDFAGSDVVTLGSSDVFLAELDLADGDQLALHHFGTPGASVQARCLAVDADGRLVLAGMANDDIDLGGGLLDHAGDDKKEDAFVAVYDTTGNAVWTKLYGEVGIHEDIRALSIGASGQIATVGQIGDGPAPSSADDWMRIMRVLPGGDAAIKDITGVDSLRYGVAVDAAGDILLATAFAGSVDFGDGAISGLPGGSDGIVVKLEGNSFTPAWKLSFGSRQDDEARAVALDGEGGAFVLGNFHGEISLEGCAPLVSEGDLDVVLMKITP